MPKTGTLKVKYNRQLVSLDLRFRVFECVIVSGNHFYFSIPIRCLGSPRTLGYLFILTVFSEVSYFNVISHR